MDGHDHMHGGAQPPPLSSSSSPTMMHPDSNDHMLMHMTFFWGKNAAVLFDGWPGTSTGMYVLCLFVIFFLAVLTEWIGHSRFIAGRASGLVQTVAYTLRMSLAYLVMLAVMSFNGGVFLVAVAGHGIGFLVFRSRVLKDSDNQKTADVSTPSYAC